MITQCCVCGSTTGDDNREPVGKISHGYCAECAKAVIREWKLEEAKDGSEGATEAT